MRASRSWRHLYVSVVNRDIAFEDASFHKREIRLLASRNATDEDFRTVMAALANDAIDVGAIVARTASA